MKKLILFTTLLFTLAACDQSKSQEDVYAQPAPQPGPGPIPGPGPKPPAPSGQPVEDANLTQTLIKSFAATIDKLHLELNEEKIKTDTLQANLYKNGDEFSILFLSCDDLAGSNCKAHYTLNYRISVSKIFDETTVSIFFTGGKRADGTTFNEIRSRNGWFENMPVPKTILVQAVFGNKVGLKLPQFVARPPTPTPAPAPTPTPVQPQPPAPTPQPSPVPPPPPPGPEVSWPPDSSAQIAEVCDKLPTNEQTIACLKKFKDGRVDPEAINVCKHLPTWPASVDCMLQMKNKRFSPGVIEVCNHLPTWPASVSCMNDLADLYLDATTVRICNRLPTWPATVSCLKELGRR